MAYISIFKKQPQTPVENAIFAFGGIDIDALSRRRSQGKAPADVFSERGAFLIPLLGLSACGGGGGANDVVQTLGISRLIFEPAVDASTITFNAAGVAVLGGITNVLANDVPATGTVVTAVVAGGTAGSGGVGTAVAGTLGSLTLSAAGAISYLPGTRATALPAGQVGTDVFTYTGANGTISASSQLTFRITGVNDAPVTGGPSSAAVRPNTSQALTGITISDPDTGDTLTVRVTAVPTGPGAGVSRTDGGPSLVVGDTLTVAELQSLFVRAGGLGSTPGTFSYEVRDAAGLTATKAIAITLTEPTVTPTGPTLVLGSITTAQGTIFTGTANSGFGAAIAGGIDINGDGVRDFIVGAPSAGRGSINVYSTNGTAGTPTVLNGGAQSDRFGASIALSPVSISGSAAADLVVGAPGAVGTAQGLNQGAAYVIYGGGALALPDGLTSTNGFVLQGSESGTPFIITGIIGPQDLGTNLGYYVNALGNVGGSAEGDFFVGIPGKENIANGVFGNDAGLAIIDFGQATSNARYNITSYGETITAANFTEGAILQGRNTLNESFSGPAVSGNFAGSASLDVAVGNTFTAIGALSPPLINDNIGRGSVVISIDGLGGLGSNLNGVSSIGRITIAGERNDDYFGTALAFGNVDNIGGADLIIGAYGSDLGGLDSGAVYIVHDLASFTATSNSINIDLSLAVWTNNTTVFNGVTISRIAGNSTIDKNFGVSVTYLGNFDGTPGDFAVGTIAFNDGNNSHGYLINGGTAANIGTRNISAPDGVNVTQLVGPTVNSSSIVVVANVGDINGLGQDDLGIGISGANRAYIIYAKTAGQSAAALSVEDTGLSYDNAGVSVDEIISQYAGSAPASTQFLNNTSSADFAIPLSLPVPDTLLINDII